MAAIAVILNLTCYCKQSAILDFKRNLNMADLRTIYYYLNVIRHLKELAKAVRFETHN